MVHLWLLLQVQTWKDEFSGEESPLNQGDSSGPPVVEILEVVKTD